MTIMAYSLCLLSIFYMIYSINKNAKYAFLLTPYKIDIKKLDFEKEKIIVKMLRIQYTQIAMAILTNMIIEVLSIVNCWDKNISLILGIILMIVVFSQVFIIKKRIKIILG